MRKTLMTLGLVALFGAMGVQTSQAKLYELTPPTGDLPYWLSVDFTETSPVPLGYYNLCFHGNAVCQQSREGRLPATVNGAVRLTASLKGQLEAVNGTINHTIRQVSDGRRDVWQVGGKRGDCEDFALTKKKRLMEVGWPSSALLIALAATGAGEQHAVLIARTDHGDLILDNLTNAVREWTPSVYRWEMVQSPSDTWTWYRLGHGKPATRDIGDERATIALAALTSLASWVGGSIRNWLSDAASKQLTQESNDGLIRVNLEQ